jgi:hypothetical protein
LEEKLRKIVNFSIRARIRTEVYFYPHNKSKGTMATISIFVSIIYSQGHKNNMNENKIPETLDVSNHCK